MAYYSSSGSQDEFQWDLRQFYTQFVAMHMGDFYEAQKFNKYPLMLKELKKWHAVIWGRVVRDFQKDPVDKLFEDLITDLIKSANKYKTTYFGRDKNPEAIDELDRKFSAIEVYLISLMEKNSMFGSRRNIAGL